MIGGVVVLGLLCWLAALGFTAITEVLVTLVALVVLVGGGNWLSGRPGTRSRPTYAAPPPGGQGPAAEPSGDDDRGIAEAPDR
jgi:hypothetical protein